MPLENVVTFLNHWHFVLKLEGNIYREIKTKLEIHVFIIFEINNVLQYRSYIHAPIIFIYKTYAVYEYIVPIFVEYTIY